MTETQAEATQAAQSDEEINKQLESDLNEVLAGNKTFAEVLGFTGEYLYELAGMGYKLLQQGNYDDAEVIFRGLVRLNPKDANLHMWLGSTLHRKGDADGAIEAYTNGLAQDPENVACLANRGELYVIKERADDGLKDLMKAIELDPEAKEPTTVRARAIVATVAKKLKEKQGG